MARIIAIDGKENSHNSSKKRVTNSNKKRVTFKELDWNVEDNKIHRRKDWKKQARIKPRTQKLTMRTEHEVAWRLLKQKTMKMVVMKACRQSDQFRVIVANALYHNGLSDGHDSLQDVSDALDELHANQNFPCDNKHTKKRLEKIHTMFLFYAPNEIEQMTTQVQRERALNDDNASSYSDTTVSLASEVDEDSTSESDSERFVIRRRQVPREEEEEDEKMDASESDYSASESGF